MKKTLPLFWAVLVCLLGLSATVQAQVNFRTAPAELSAVQQTVNDTRKHWTLMFPADELPEFGFKNAEELYASVPGSPMQVYYMGRNQNTGAVEVNASVEFLVPLTVQGEARAFLTVAYFEDRFQVVSVGQMNLAKDAAPYLAQHNNARSNGLVWLKDVNHAADFIAERGTSLDVATVVFTPLFTAKRAEFHAPIAYRELLGRVQAMPVQFD